MALCPRLSTLLIPAHFSLKKWARCNKGSCWNPVCPATSGPCIDGTCNKNKAFTWTNCAGNCQCGNKRGSQEWLEPAGPMLLSEFYFGTHYALVGMVALVMRLQWEPESATHGAAKTCKEPHTHLCNAPLHGTTQNWGHPGEICLAARLCVPR